MKNASTFQTVLLGVFGFAILGAIVLFATSKSDGTDALPSVTMWGTIPASSFTKAISEINQVLPGESKLSISYVEKREQDFDKELTEALASGVGPDMIFYPHTSLLKEKDRIFPIPATTLPLRTYMDAFVDEAELYVFPEGIMALPMSVDPMVMYWNKNIFSSAGLAVPPKAWDELFTLAPQLTKKDSAGNIIQSAAALGEYANIVNAKDIVATLFLQAGTSIVGRDSNTNLLRPTLLSGGSASNAPAEAALRFYTEFANPSKTSYIWNRSLRDSLTLFIRGDLGMYFGFASDQKNIEAKNPNLNFDVAAMPQPRDARTKLNFGKMYGISIMKSSKKISGAYQVATILARADFVSRWSALSGFTPARRDLLSTPQQDPDKSVAYASALISRGWLDPDANQTSLVFKSMIEQVTSGQSRPSEAILEASQRIQVLIR